LFWERHGEKKMIETKLGKITRIKFGYVGYQDMQFGLYVEFSGDGWGVSTTISNAWSLDMEVGAYTKWTEADRDAGFARTMREVNRIMKEAKVTDVNGLAGIPVQITFENMMLKDWRVLTEVL
jgi:hypothetical protein